MMKRVLLVFVCFLSAVKIGESVKCYHCFEMFAMTITSESVIDPAKYTDKFVPCGINKSNWNVWECPNHYPVCVVLTGQRGKSYELSRTCAEENFCSKLIPANGWRLDTCRECNTTLCNDYPELLIQPNYPGPHVNFNVNVNLNVRKLPVGREL